MSASEPAILAIDAAGGACSAAVWAENGLASRRFLAMSRGQSEHLVPMIAGVMGDWGGGFEALDALAVTTGPGGFTGVRIGLATARGFALARRLPLIGLSSFEVSAAAATIEERAGRVIAALIDSKRQDVFLQLFDTSLAPLGDPREIALDNLEGSLPEGPLLLTGDAAERCHQVLARAGRGDCPRAAGAGAADAALLAERAALHLRQGGRPARGAAGTVVPLYLREPDVTPPKKPKTSRNKEPGPTGLVEKDAP